MFGIRTEDVIQTFMYAQCTGSYIEVKYLFGYVENLVIIILPTCRLFTT